MKLSDIKRLHLELTSACNASCPLCMRTNSSYKYNQDFKNIDVLLNQIDGIIDQLRYVYFCGNVGDPLASQHLLTVLKHLRKNPKIKISIHTNGGLRNPAYYEQLADLTDDIIFAIDGLQTTNHLYRVGVDWRRLMDNVQSFIDSGGKAEWHYLVFEHNFHELEQARRLAHDLGFVKFVSKKAHRFKVVDGQPQALDMNNQYGQYSIMPSQTMVEFDNRRAIYEQCPTEKSGELYIDYLGHVVPCCYTGIAVLKILQNDQSSECLNLMQIIGDLSAINLHQRDLVDIVESEIFDKFYHQSQMYKVDICNRVCFRKNPITN